MVAEAILYPEPPVISLVHRWINYISTYLAISRGIGGTINDLTGNPTSNLTNG